MTIKRLENPKGRPYEVILTVDGRMIRRRFQTKREAVTFEATVIADSARGEFIHPAKTRIKLADYAAHWLATRTVAPSTYASYETNLRLHIVPYLGERPLSSIRRSDIQKLVSDLDVSGLSRSTVRHTAQLLAMVLREAVRDRRLVVSPYEKITLPPSDQRELAMLTAAELTRLFGAAAPIHRPLIMLAAATGVRQGELLGLTVGNIDFLRGVVKIRTQLQTHTGRGPVVSERLKTAASRRDVPVPKAILALISGCLSDRRPGPDELVFLNQHGRPWRKNTFNEVVWKATLRRAGLNERFGFHALRHSYVAMLIDDNVHPRVIQARLGHRSIAETMDTYGHLVPEAHERTNAAIEAALSLSPPAPQAL